MVYRQVKGSELKGETSRKRKKGESTFKLSLCGTSALRVYSITEANQPDRRGKKKKILAFPQEKGKNMNRKRRRTRAHHHGSREIGESGGKKHRQRAADSITFPIFSDSTGRFQNKKRKSAPRPDAEKKARPRAKEIGNRDAPRQAIGKY